MRETGNNQTDKLLEIINRILKVEYRYHMTIAKSEGHEKLQLRSGS